MNVKVGNYIVLKQQNDTTVIAEVVGLEYSNNKVDTVEVAPIRTPILVASSEEAINKIKKRLHEDDEKENKSYNNGIVW